MRKFILLFSLVFFALAVSAQKDTLYYITFENLPTDTTDLVTQGVLIPGTQGTPPRWEVVDTFGYNSSNSYHVKGKLAGHTVYMQTDTIDATGKPYISLTFWHIAKLWSANQASIRYSLDAGQTWAYLPLANTYQGASPNYGDVSPKNPYFNQISYINLNDIWQSTNSYATPLPSWWQKETYDLSGVFSNLTTNQGYDSIIIRFAANFALPINGVTTNYSDGWYVDDILVTGAPCELNPPKISFAFTPQSIPGGPSCYDPNPEGGQVQLASANYPFAARVTDNAKTYDTGTDTVYAVFRVNGGAWDTVGLDLINPSPSIMEFRGFFTNLAVGDSVDWYLMAFDGGCPPNEARAPDVTYNGVGYYSFFIEKGLPGKCGTPNCGTAPYVIRNFPWFENFDGPDWIAASGTNISGTIPTSKYWDRNYATDQYGWTVKSGPTPTIYTGPNTDHTTGNSTGKYLYAESDGVANAGPAILSTPCFDLTNQTGCLGFEFYYHMFGSEMGELIVDIDTGQGIVSLPADVISRYSDLVGEHQKSSTEPWQRAVFSLDDFVGKYIKIKFRVRPLPGKPYVLKRGDLAIDDMRIFFPDPVDVEVIANPDPQNGYCDYAGLPVKVVVRNNGCNPISSVPLRYKLSSSATVYSVNATLDTTLYLGDTTTYSFTGAQAFPTIATGTHQITAWCAVTGDADNSNDTTVGPNLEYNNTISTFPYIEDFENATVGTQNLGNTNWRFDDGLNPNFKWQVGEEMTTERSTGPFSGYHYKGKYLYTISNGTTGGLSTYLRTLCLDLSTMGTNHHATLDFYYHMYGADIDKLEVQVSLGNEPIDVWTTISTISGNGQQANELANWKLKRVDLSSYTGSIKIRFKGTRKGTGAKTHLALDKIMIYNRAANDAGGYVIDGPGGRGITAGPSGTADPQVSIANFGYNPLNNCTIHFKITPLCNPSAAVTYNYYYSGPAIPEGTTKTVNITSAGVTYPIGEFRASVYVSKPNGTTDNITFNDTISRNIIGGNTNYNIPWATNFDTCDYEDKGFIPSGTFWQWEKGKPSVATSGLITDDRSGGGNAWVTNIDGPFLVGTTEYLRTPVYDKFDTVVNAKLNFYMNLDLGPNVGSGTTYNVAATCTYFQAGWQILGANTIAANLGKNWYGGPNGAPSIDMFGGPGWVGGSGNGTWIETEYPLNQFNLNPSAALALRFQFQSLPAMSQSQARGGMGIDDFRIYIPPQNSVSPVKVTTTSPLPLPGFEQELNISVKNTGEKVIDSFMVYVEIDNVPLGPAYWEIVKPNGYLYKDRIYSFKYKYKWPAASVTSGNHNICIWTSRPDNKPDNRPYDDTLCDNLPVMLELDFTANGQDEYCEDFESSTTFQWLHKDAKDLFEKDNCWEKGFPTQIGAAYSGNNVWMTHLDSNYTKLEQAALFTPVFEVDSGIQYKLEFYHWIQSERYHDGGNVEYSFDGGITWYPIGYSQKGVKTWYSDPFVTALDQIRGGWTDTTGGWINAVQRIVFQDHGKVILRFRFGADYDIQGKGWAIDDMCWTKDTSSNKPDVIIGEDEYQLPVEAIVGDMVPNPASDYSELSFLFPTPYDVEIRVYNLVGQLMESRSESFREGANRVSFETSNWSAGVYFVNFEYGGKLVTRKLVVK